MTHSPSRRSSRAVQVAMVASVLILAGIPAMAFDQVNTTFFGVAIRGYDTVATTPRVAR